MQPMGEGLWLLLMACLAALLILLVILLGHGLLELWRAIFTVALPSHPWTALGACNP
jgi:hypothetical protein